MKATAKGYKEYRTINGTTFEYYPNQPQEAVKKSIWDFDNIHQAYSKPSSRKVAIWESWYRWYADTFRKTGFNAEGITMFISSANCHFFSISANICDPETAEMLVLHITPAHNYAYPMA